MAIVAPGFPEETRETLWTDLSGMGNFFIDPAAAARCVFRKWFWVGPAILMSIVAVLVQLQMMPMIQHVMEVAPMPANSDPAQYQKGIHMAMTIQHVVLVVMPVFILAILAIQAGLVTGTAILMGIKAKFLSVFNLICGVSLIGSLGAIATAIIVRAKGDPSTMAELKPPLGFDIFLPEGTNKFLMAILSYFSVFQIWTIVMFVLIFSVAFRAKKGTAFMTYVPVIFLTLLFMLVGAAFSPK
jgi:hypothetical protein